MDMSQISEYIRASKDVLDILRSLSALLPKGPDADAAQQRLEQAEKALRASEAQLAQSLGYKLCQCTFPPNPMLSHGYHPRYGDEVFKCPSCGKQIPSEQHFEMYDSVDAHNERAAGNSWADARKGRR
ncbi:MAG: hypothetical protein CMM50_11030 [Rhodospirillaceae bacterium]|nr:hypothetical protein [Rhodospirillaceae bacterium]